MTAWRTRRIALSYNGEALSRKSHAAGFDVGERDELAFVKDDAFWVPRKTFHHSQALPAAIRKTNTTKANATTASKRQLAAWRSDSENLVRLIGGGDGANLERGVILIYVIHVCHWGVPVTVLDHLAEKKANTGISPSLRTKCAFRLSIRPGSGTTASAHERE